MAHRSGILRLRRTSGFASAWGNRDSQAEEQSPDGDRGFGSIRDVFVFGSMGGRPVTANRLVQTEIGIDRSVRKAVGFVARRPPAPAHKTSEDESEECRRRKIATFIGWRDNIYRPRKPDKGMRKGARRSLHLPVYLTNNRSFQQSHDGIMRTHGRSEFARIFRVAGHEPNASAGSDSEVLLPHPRRVRFWIEGGRLVTANRLVQTQIGIDRSVRKAVGLVARCPLAPANKTSEDESEECRRRKIATFIE
jgi:hypothetical protein